MDKANDYVVVPRKLPECPLISGVCDYSYFRAKNPSQI